MNSSSETRLSSLIDLPTRRRRLLDQESSVRIIRGWPTPGVRDQALNLTLRNVETLKRIGLLRPATRPPDYDFALNQQFEPADFCQQMFGVAPKWL
jgi:hypothetical protein